MEPLDDKQSRHQLGVQTFPIAEIFGPTLQGEGAGVGTLCVFVRFGGCDSDCVWCDSRHAVDSAAVRALPRKSAQQILQQVNALPARAEWIVLTGGNPALHDLTELVGLLQADGYKISVETQGTRWQSWLTSVDLLCLSPKPPSSRMPFDRLALTTLISRLRAAQPWFLKVTVLGQEDLAFAMRLRDAYAATPLYLSIVTLPGEGLEHVLERTRGMHERLVTDYPAALRNGVRVLPQLHFLLWGNERGH